MVRGFLNVWSFHRNLYASVVGRRPTLPWGNSTVDLLLTQLRIATYTAVDVIKSVHRTIVYEKTKKSRHTNKISHADRNLYHSQIQLQLPSECLRTTIDYFNRTLESGKHPHTTTFFICPLPSALRTPPEDIMKLVATRHIRKNRRYRTWTYSWYHSSKLQTDMLHSTHDKSLWEYYVFSKTSVGKQHNPFQAKLCAEHWHRMIYAETSRGTL